MSKSLVIVESPAKAKTINKYLGPEFIVKSSVGHIRDLPTSGNGKPVDAKARAAAAAKTRKMAPEEKAAYKKKKAKVRVPTAAIVRFTRAVQLSNEVNVNMTRRAVRTLSK